MSEIEKETKRIAEEQQNAALGTSTEDESSENLDKKITKEIRQFPESMSPTIGELAGALAKAQGEMSNGLKGKQGYGYKYMELGSLTDIIRPATTKNGISIIQTHELVKGKVPSVVTHTTIMHSSGEWHKSSIELPLKVMPQLSPAQMIGVNCTYGRRYALQALSLIASEEDTDGTK